MKRKIVYLMIIAGVVLRCCIRGESADYTWTNNASGSWSVPVNCTPNSSPGVSDTAIFDNTKEFHHKYNNHTGHR
jgi:hypothetical protein